MQLKKLQLHCESVSGGRVPCGRIHPVVHLAAALLHRCSLFGGQRVLDVTVGGGSQQSWTRWSTGIGAIAGQVYAATDVAIVL